MIRLMTLFCCLWWLKRLLLVHSHHCCWNRVCRRVFGLFLMFQFLLCSAGSASRQRFCAESSRDWLIGYRKFWVFSPSSLPKNRIRIFFSDSKELRWLKLGKNSISNSKFEIKCIDQIEIMLKFCIANTLHNQKNKSKLKLDQIKASKSKQNLEENRIKSKFSSRSLDHVQFYFNQIRSKIITYLENPLSTWQR